MQAHILSLHTPSTPRWGPRSNIVLLKVVMLLNKLKGKEHRVPCKHTICLNTHPRSLGWDQRSKHFFSSESSHYMLHIKLMGMEHRARYKHVFCPYTHLEPLGWGQKVITFLLKVVMLRVKLKGMTAAET